MSKSDLSTLDQKIQLVAGILGLNDCISVTESGILYEYCLESSDGKYRYLIPQRNNFNHDYDEYYNSYDKAQVIGWNPKKTDLTFLQIVDLYLEQNLQLEKQ